MLRDPYAGRKDRMKKTFLTIVIANSLQIASIILLTVLLIIKPDLSISSAGVRLMVIASALVLIIGAVRDIQEAFATRRMADRLDAMDDSLNAQEQLNVQLRSQRHDFLNHLQVVYSLMEMGDYDEASAYITRVYGAITNLSKVLKTANPAVNALLQVKLASCKEKGIETEVKIQSAWKDLPMPGWEFCKVLGNLMDNAMDALMETSDRKLSLTLTEDLKCFRFIMWNNGPMIPEKNIASIFRAGFSSKGTDRGMGLHIVRGILEEAGGGISVTSEEAGTAFEGWIPKLPPIAKQPDNA